MSGAAHGPGATYPKTIDGSVFAGGSDVYPLAFEGKPKDGYRYDLARGDMEASWARRRGAWNCRC